MSKEQYESWSRLVAFALKAIGAIGIVAVFAIWFAFNRIELAFLPFFGTLAGVGLGVDVLKENAQNKGGPPV